MKYRHNSILQLVRGSIYEGYGGKCATAILADYISRIDTPETPVRYVIEARTDYALGVVFHGLPEEGIKAIDSIFQDYTEEEINQAGNIVKEQLIRWRDYANKKLLENSGTK